MKTKTQSYQKQTQNQNQNQFINTVIEETPNGNFIVKVGF